MISGSPLKKSAPQKSAHTTEGRAEAVEWVMAWLRTLNLVCE